MKTDRIKATGISFSGKDVTLFLNNREWIAFPLKDFKRLQDATQEHLHNYSFIGNGIGIHWSDLDEDISVEGLLKIYGSSEENGLINEVDYSRSEPPSPPFDFADPIFNDPAEYGVFC